MAHIDLLQNDIATNPQSGYYRVYFKSDGFPYYRNNAGTETAFTVGSLSDYVTIATPQTITGAKTFSSAVNLGSVGSTTALTPLAVDASGNVVNGSSLSGRQVDSVVGGTNITITTPGVNPTVNLDASISNAITSNTTDIATNTTNIATNTTNIATNTTNIATNATNISTNDTDIATNASNIATNTTNIASNDTDIATNATNIATNTTNIATNVTAIATNATDIAANTTLANSKVASVTGGTNVTITGTATNPIVNSTSVTPAISLQDAYDDSTTPEITTDATRGAVSIKRGSALDTDNVLEVQDGTGANTFRVTGEGLAYSIVYTVLNGGQLRLNGAGTSSISLNNDGTNKGSIYADESSLYLGHDSPSGSPTEVIIGATTIEASGNLEVIGDTTCSGTLSVTSPTTVNTFIVNGTSTLNSTLDVTGAINGGGTAAQYLDGTGNYTTPSGGSGDVVGPSSSTDTAIAVYDSTSGKLIKNSGVLIDASNNVTIPGQMSSSKIFLQALGSDPGTTFTGDIWRVGGDIKAKGNIVLTNDITAQGDMFANDITATGTIKAAGSGDATKFLNGLGAYTTPSGGGTASPLPIMVLTSNAADAGFGPTLGSLVVPWNIETEKDTGFSHSNTTNTTRAIVDNDGTYLIQGRLRIFNSVNQRAQPIVNIKKNGSILRAALDSSYIRNASGASDYWTLNFTYEPVKLNAMDFIEVELALDVGSTPTFNSSLLKAAESSLSIINLQGTKR